LVVKGAGPLISSYLKPVRILLGDIKQKKKYLNTGKVDNSVGFFIIEALKGEKGYPSPLLAWR